MRNLCVVLLALASVAHAADVSDAFYTAIRNGDGTTVKSLIVVHGANIKDNRGTTPLMYAAAFGNAEMVGMLLDAGADPNVANDLGATALMWSVNDEEKVRLLLFKKANVNAKSKFGRTPLIIAASEDSGMPVVRMLVEKGADVNAADHGPPSTAGTVGRPNITPLLAAASSSNPDMVRYLITKRCASGREGRGRANSFDECGCLWQHRGDQTALGKGRGRERRVRCGSISESKNRHNSAGVVHGPQFGGCIRNARNDQVIA